MHYRAVHCPLTMCSQAAATEFIAPGKHNPRPCSEGGQGLSRGPSQPWHSCMAVSVWARFGDWLLLCTPERDWMSFLTIPQDDLFIQLSTWSSWKLSISLLVHWTREFLTVCLIRAPLLWHMDFNICIVSMHKLQNERYCRKKEMQ